MPKICQVIDKFNRLKMGIYECGGQSVEYEGINFEDVCSLKWINVLLIKVCLSGNLKTSRVGKYYIFSKVYIVWFFPVQKCGRIL